MSYNSDLQEGHIPPLSSQRRPPIDDRPSLLIRELPKAFSCSEIGLGKPVVGTKNWVSEKSALKTEESLTSTAFQAQSPPGTSSDLPNQ